MLRPTARRSLPTILALVLFLPASAAADGFAPEDGLTDFASIEATNSGLKVCDGKPVRPKQDVVWRKKRNRILTKAAGPRHVAEDIVSQGGKKIELRAKFTYGRTSKDLEEEDVLVSLHTCDGWKPVGEGTTDDDGWLRMSATAPEEPGVYAVAFTVKGDRSQVFSRLWVLPPGQRLVVLDIDGTMTTDDEQIKNEVLEDHFNKIGAGTHDPLRYPHAVELTHALARRGDVIVYLSGRPYWLIAHSRHWLDKHGFAPGVVLHTRQHREVVPDVTGVGQFKRDHIAALRAGGFIVAEGYGNAHTDVWAYAAAGIPAKSTWIIGPLEDKGKAHDVRGGWEGVVKALQTPKQQ